MADTIISPAAAAGEPAQPQAIQLTSYPTTQDGNLYVENREMFASLPLTTGQSSTTAEPYVFGSVYAVTIPNLQPDNVIDCKAQAEITNPYQYNVQIDRGFAIGTTDEAFPNTIDPLNAENVTPAEHHMAINLSDQFRGYSGTVTVSLVLSAASTSAELGDAVHVEQGYGYLKCHVMNS